jgi:hypothetical protein
MTNRNSLLGRSRPREKLTREEIAALDARSSKLPRFGPFPRMKPPPIALLQSSPNYCTQV